MGINAECLPQGTLYRGSLLINMIFLTLGSQQFQFNRLIKSVDNLIGSGVINGHVFGQTGYSTYVPVHFEFQSFLDQSDFARAMECSQCVITHGGTGAIVRALKLGKKVIAIPRRSVFGEHVDDHQVEIIERFGAMGVIEPCLELQDLASAISKSQGKTYSRFKSNSERFIADLQEYLDSVGEE